MNKLLPTITEITLTPITPRDGLVAFASLTFNDCLRLNDIAVHTDIKNGGFRLCYPVKEIFTGKKINIYFPINKETGKILTEVVSAELNKIINKNVNDNVRR